MLKSESKTINGTQYEVTQLPYSAGKRLLLVLYKVLGPTIGRAVAAAPGLQSKAIGDIQVSELAPSFSAAVEQLARDMTEQDFDLMVDTLSEYTMIVDDKGIKHQLTGDQREFRFAGNYLELFQWLAFALRVNYLGFLKGRDVIAELARKAEEAKARVSQSQTT